MDDDLVLIERWRAGDTRAGEELCARYLGELYRFFEYKLEDKADDLVQQTFMACLRGREQFRGESRFRTYLFTLARNELYMELRRSRREYVDLEVSSLNELVSSPRKQLEKQRELARLRAALRELSVEQQVLLELRYWHDFSADDLAEMYAATPGSIRIRLMRARQALRARLADMTGSEIPHDRLWESLLIDADAKDDRGGET